MTVYYYDLFTGTAGTLLTSHTADSGATWPNDANHYYGTGIVTLDGLGGVYQSNTGSSINLSSAAMPSTQNFEVLFSYIRKTSIAANAGLIFLSSSWPTIADCYELFYAEGDGWLLYHTSISGSTNTLLAGPYAGPALGVTWYMKVDVSTSGGNTTFTVCYSIASTGPFTQLFSYTAATSTDLVAVGTWFYNPSTASTASTGQHIGALTVQNIPALSSATLSGPTQQLFSTPAEFTVELNEPAGTGGVVVTLSSSNGSDTFQATQGGANLTSITLAAGQPSGTFWLTPGGATGDRTITIASSGLTCPGSPFTYDALPTATGYTVTGVTGGHQLVPATWTVTLAGGDFVGTITATPGGGTGQCQIFSPTTVTFTGNGTLSKTFVFTPLDQDSVTWTFTNSGSLINQSPVTYTSTRMYYQDTFAGSSGTSIQSHSSNVLPGLTGSAYTVTGTGTIELDGSGMAFLSSTGNTYALTQAVLPMVQTGVTFEVLFDIEQMTPVASYGGIMLMLGGGNQLDILMGADNTSLFYLRLNGVTVAWTPTNLPPIGQLWHIKLDFIPQASYEFIYSYYSTDGVNWYDLLTVGNPWTPSLSSLPTAIAVGPYFSGAVGTPTTGVHVGNIVVRDIAPASPNCQISNAYVTTGGQSVAFFFETISGNTSVLPTALNYAPSFFKNGISIGAGINAWVTGYHSCAIVQLQPGVQINPGDTVTVSTPASWMSCGTSNAANQVTNLTIGNYTGQSCFGTASLAKTFKPGLNFSDLGSLDYTLYNVPRNWRYRLSNGYTIGQGPTDVCYSFLNLSENNGIDSTNYPGIPGYWAIGFDDNYIAAGGVATAITIVSQGSGCTVTQDSDCTSVSNPGSGGLNQYYMFIIARDGSGTSNTPLSIQMVNSQSNPHINNLWIVGPGDFTYTSGTPLTFDRSNPYALSGQFLSRLANGIGSMRWVDSTIGFANQCPMTEPWEEPQLNAFSWNNENYPSFTITYTQARALSTSTSPYIYSSFLGSVGIGSTWTCSSGLTAAITSTTQTTITISSAATDPIFCGVLIQIDSEKMQVQGASGSSVTVFRGACDTTAATHSSGAGVTILSTRWAWTSLANLVGAVPQCLEIVCAAPHGLTEQTQVSLGSGWPTLTFTDGSTLDPGSINFPNAGYGPFITGPNTFAVTVGRSSGSGAVTLSAPSGPVSIPITWNPSSGNGFPMEFIAMTTGSFSGANLHVNIPLMATDAYVYDVAAKILANFPSGRRVYVELSDEPWNWWPGGAFYTAIGLSYQAQVPNFYYYIVMRTGQIRTIFRNVFGSRSGEIYVMTNNQWGSGGPWISYTGTPTSGDISGMGSLQLAAYYGVTIDCFAIAPYVGGGNLSATVNAWNNSSTIQQMIDLFVHDMYYDTQGWNAAIVNAQETIAAYNATSVSPNYNGTTGTCCLYGYEGGWAAPPDMNNGATISRDVCYDPNFLIIEQDFYALLQRSGFANVNLYSYDIYYDGTANWGLYHSPYQPYGKGDGSDGKANNRLCLATPGFEYSKAATTNQDQNTVSVRGQAFLEWMQPAQGKKRMLFVPYRFVNR